MFYTVRCNYVEVSDLSKASVASYEKIDLFWILLIIKLANSAYVL